MMTRDVMGNLVKIMRVYICYFLIGTWGMICPLKRSHLTRQMYLNIICDLKMIYLINPTNDHLD